MASTDGAECPILHHHQLAGAAGKEEDCIGVAAFQNVEASGSTMVSEWQMASDLAWQDPFVGSLHSGYLQVARLSANPRHGVIADRRGEQHCMKSAGRKRRQGR